MTYLYTAAKRSKCRGGWFINASLVALVSFMLLQAVLTAYEGAQLGITTENNAKWTSAADRPFLVEAPAQSTVTRSHMVQTTLFSLALSGSALLAQMLQLLKGRQGYLMKQSRQGRVISNGCLLMLMISFAAAVGSTIAFALSLSKRVTIYELRYILAIASQGAWFLVNAATAVITLVFRRRKADGGTLSKRLAHNVREMVFFANIVCLALSTAFFAVLRKESTHQASLASRLVILLQPFAYCQCLFASRSVERIVTNLCRPIDSVLYFRGIVIGTDNWG